MDSFGTFIRQARETKHLSLEQVASQTRIQQNYLEALENEDFGRLPGKVFAKGFVKSYAKALGLNEEDALQRFLASSGHFYEQTQQEHQLHQTQIQTERKGKLNRNWVLVFFLVMGFGIFYFLPSQQQPSETDPQPAEAPSPEVKKELPEPSLPTPMTKPSPLPPASVQTPKPALEQAHPSAPATRPPDESPQIPAPPKVEPSSSQPIHLPTPPVAPTPNPPQAGPLLLEIEAIQLTWVVVGSDDLPPKEALLQPGQRITWRASKQFLLTLGNAGGVIVRLNGETQEPFGKPGQVVRNILIKP
jgi:cytoskeleton protein RodZ